MRRHLRFAAVPAAALLAAGAAAGCKSGSGEPAPTPTQAAVRTAAPTPAKTPVDPAKLPEAWRADAAGLPAHVLEPLAFIKFMLDEHEPTMSQVVCHCCNKSLAQCYLDTATRAAKACSPL